MLTIDRLKSLLSYNPNSGVFHHITDKGPQGRIWSIAGTICKDGYIAITSKREGLSSKYKGVTWHKKDKIWRCAIVVNGVRHMLGNFKNEDDAGRRYNEAALQYFGEYAKLNVLSAEAQLVEV